jgi:mannose/fructose/N-acetylgalactosamine-specific phosphotransferase system component IIB
VSWTLVRVDDRLIHGQVVIAWGARLVPQRIWVVDDVSAANAWERDLLASGAPGVDVRVVTVEEAAAGWATETTAAGGAFLILRDLRTAWALVEAGARFPVLNLGGLHYAPGKTKVNEYVYLDDDDRAIARRLIGAGMRLEVQDVPASRAMTLTELDPRVAAPA